MIERLFRETTQENSFSNFFELKANHFDMFPLQFFYFDLGNVLLFFDHELVVRNIASLAGAETDLVRRTVFTSGLEDAYETGKLTSRQFVEEISRRLGCELPFAETLEAASDIFTPNASIIPILERLKHIGMRLGILSNTCEAHWNWVKKRRFEVLQSWFEGEVLSFQEGSMKPSPSIYRSAIEKAGVAPERIGFVDDRWENVQGALSAGMQARVFEGAEALGRWIDEWEHPLPPMAPR